MSRRRKIQFAQLLFILAAWVVAAFLIATYDYFFVNAHEIHASPSQYYSFWSDLIVNLYGAFVATLTAGSLFVFYLNVKFINKPYGYSILINCLTYIVIVTTTTAVAGFSWVPYATGIHVGEPGFGQAYKNFLLDPYHLNNILVWSIVVALTQFVLLMNNKFGHGVLWDILRGKYHLSRKETRIFMFADLNDSTTIAEKLGDERYHNLLKDFFADVTNPIINRRGDIYQYIGDEIIVVWEYQNGISSNNCVQCFFDMKKAIEENRQHYLNKFGLIPEFKAGIHFGKVVAGEIGIMKRDITFSGDVLNTTSRIENKCKEFKVDLIASDELLSQLSFGDQFILQSLGNIKLRGKEKEMGLSTLLAR